MRKTTVYLAGLVMLGVLSACTNPAAGSASPNGEQTAKSAETISGTITLAGIGVKGVSVKAGSASTTTNASGNYTISGLPAGSYTVTPSLANYSFSPQTLSVTIGSSGASGEDFSSTPAIPTPTSYTENLPSQSAPVLVGVTPLNGGFTPQVLGAYVEQVGFGTPTYTWESPTALNISPPTCLTAGLPEADQPATTSGVTDRVLLASSGSVVQSPAFWYCANAGALPLSSSQGGLSMKPLTQVPLLELTAYWQLLPSSTSGQAGTSSIQRYPAGTNTTVSATYTVGVTNTNATDTTNTVSASETAKGEWGPATVSETLAYSWSQQTSNSLTTSSSSTTSQSFEVSLPTTEEGVYAVWQLVYQLRIVRPATPSEVTAGKDSLGDPVDQFGYVTFDDPNFISPSGTSGFAASDFAPLDIDQQNDVVPLMTFFNSSTGAPVTSG